MGNFLNDLFDRTQQLIQQFENAGKSLAIEGGIQLRQTIEAARAAYVDSLNLTMDRVDQTTRNTFDQMRQLVQQAEQGQINAIQTLSSRAQQIANTLPGSNTHPQLISTTPRCTHAQGQDIVIRCFGNFVHAATNGCEATLSFQGREFTPRANSTQSLEFRVPSDVIFPTSALSQATRIIYKDGTLKLPYPGGLLSSRGVATFNVTIGTLPLTPGRIRLEWKEKGAPQKITQTFVSNLFEVCSRECCGNNDSEKLFSQIPHEGWKVEIGSSSFEIVEKGGQCENPKFEKDDAQLVVYRAKTIKAESKGLLPNIGSILPPGTIINVVNNSNLFPSKESGWLKFYILFTEWKSEETENARGEDIVLPWNSSRAFNHPIGKWRVIFDSFSGEHNEFIGPDTTSSPYIKIASQGMGFVIKAIDPRI